MRSLRKPNVKPATPADILRAFPRDVRDVAEQLRRLVKAAVPTATEHAYVGWRGIGYRDPQAGYFAGIFPQRDYVRLLFEHGGMLEDPDGILQGENVRQVRWISVRPGTRLPRTAIEQLLHRALLHGSTRRKR